MKIMMIIITFKIALKYLYIQLCKNDKKDMLKVRVIRLYIIIKLILLEYNFANFEQVFVHLIGKLPVQSQQNNVRI